MINSKNPEYPHIVSSRKLKFLKSKVQSGLLTPSILRKLANEMDYQKTLEKRFAIVLDNENNIIKKFNDAKGYQEGKIQFIDGIRKIKFKN